MPKPFSLSFPVWCVFFLLLLIQRICDFIVGNSTTKSQFRFLFVWKKISNKIVILLGFMTQPNHNFVTYFLWDLNITTKSWFYYVKVGVKKTNKIIILLLCLEEFVEVRWMIATNVSVKVTKVIWSMTDRVQPTRTSDNIFLYQMV